MKNARSKSLRNKIERSKNEWDGHVERMEEGGYTLQNIDDVLEEDFQNDCLKTSTKLVFFVHRETKRIFLIIIIQEEEMVKDTLFLNS